MPRGRPAAGHAVALIDGAQPRDVSQIVASMRGERVFGPVEELATRSARSEVVPLKTLLRHDVHTIGVGMVERAAQTPYFEVGFSITRGDTPTQYLNAGKNVRIYGFERNAVVSACLRQIVPLFSAIPYEVYVKDQTGEGDVTILSKSPLLNCLETPFYTIDPSQMRSIWATHFLAYGNAFTVILREGNRKGARAIGLRPVHPERIVYVYLDAENLEPYEYEWRDRNGVRYRTPVEDMLHWKDINVVDWLFGYPRGAAALGEIAADNEATEYSRQILTNDGTAGTIIEVDEPGITPESLEKAEDRYRQKYVERGRRGTTQFMAGLKAVHVVGSPLKDMEFPQLRKVTREDICAAFGVDPKICGFNDGASHALSGGKQFFEARFRMIQQTIIPMVHIWEAHINHWLSPEFGNVFARLSRQGLAEMTEDEQETWDRAQKSLNLGHITREEAREMVGIPAKPDETDTWAILNTTQIIPVARETEAMDQAAALSDANVDAIKNPKAPVPVGESNQTSGERVKNEKEGPGGNANDREGKGGATQQIDPKLPRSGKPDKPGETARAWDLRDLLGAPWIRAGLITRKAVLTKPMRAAIWQHKDALAREEEIKYQTTAEVRLRAERTKVREILMSVRTSRAEHVPDPYLNEALQRALRYYRQPQGEFYKQWAADYAELIGATAQVVGQQFSTAVGYNFSLQNPLIQQVISQRSARLAQLVCQTTADAVTDAIHAARELSLSMSETADLIEASVYGDEMNRSRAERIARTETIGAMNQAEMATAKLSNVVTSKEWLTQQDEAVRDSHAEQDGEERSLDEAFTNGLQHPGDPDGDPEEVINCRCTLLYHTQAERDITGEHPDTGDEEPEAPDNPEEE